MTIRNAKPFIKWVGGKQQLLTQFEAYFPPTFHRYLEPFVGGGAVFFHLWNTRRLPGQALLRDNNAELINAYRVVRDQVDDLIRSLAEHQSHHSKTYYYQIRGLDREAAELSDVAKAARTIYLNRTCYNGLYRVNRRGEFNAPMGNYKAPRILRENVLRAASAALQQTTPAAGDFREIADLAQPSDFVYFDPPYAPLSKTANFTGYTAESFQDSDQRDLAEVFTQLTNRGCLCMLSNAYTPLILELYRPFRVETVYARRAVNSDAGGRGAIKEVVVLNY